MPKIERVFTLTNLNVNCKHVLLNLIKEGKDVFIELPVQFKIFATIMPPIKNKELCKSSFLRKECDYKLTTTSQVDNIEDAVYLKLSKNDLTKLIRNEFLQLKEPDKVATNNKGTEFNFKSAFERHRYKNRYYSDTFKCSMPTFNIPKTDNNKYEFIITLRSINRPINEFELNRFLNNATSIKVELEDLLVFHEDIKSFIRHSLDQIPEDNPYYIAPHLRGLSDLDKLAEIGYKACVANEKHRVKNKDLSLLIKQQLKFPDKKADSAAFFIHPNPNRGKKANRNPRDPNSPPPTCQFTVLIYLLEEYWVKYKDADVQIVTDDILNFTELLGYSEDNRKYAELLTRPIKSGE